ncbi:MAG: DUF1080 domain-containing protein [Candidatus Sumerlaeia bacterium]|nr:DUF1080 domain-containing protein [Candidatus Sumerlaeia bacterium]
MATRTSSWTRQLCVTALILALVAPYAAAGEAKTAKKGKAGGKKGATTESPAPAASEEGFVSLFDGKTLDGWKVNENPGSFVVENGAIVTKNGTRSHLFYDGPVANHNFKNFILRMDVMTTTGANSGVFFHTQFQETGWPGIGYECQVNSTHSDPIRTGSIYQAKDLVNKAGSEHSKDGKWFALEIAVEGKKITVKVDGKVINEYTEPDNVVPPKNRPGRKLSSGTIALQAHPPIPGMPGTVMFKNIRVKVLP